MEESTEVSVVGILNSLIQASLSLRFLICEPGTGDSLRQGAEPKCASNRQTPLPFLSKHTAQSETHNAKHSAQFH